MGHPFDAEMMFVTGATLTASISHGPVTMWGQVAKGAAVRFVFEDAFGANDTVLPRVYLSADNSTYNLVASYHKGGTKVKGGKEMNVPFILPPGKWYVKTEIVITIASTTAAIPVHAGIIPNIGDTFKRTSNWA